MESPHTPETFSNKLRKLRHFIFAQLQNETPSEHHFVHKDQQEFDFLGVDDMCLGDRPPLTAGDLDARP